MGISVCNGNVGLPVNNLITAVKEALVEAGVSQANHSSKLRVASVQIVLDLVATASGGGGLKLCVPFIGTELSVKAKRSTRDVHAIDVTLVPPEPSASLPARAGKEKMKEALVQAIKSVRQAVTAAARGSDPWVLSEGIVEISFGVTKEGNISLAGEGELASDVTQKLRLILTPIPAISVADTT